MSHRYQDWECARWETPLSNVQSIIIESMRTGGGLEVTADLSTAMASVPKIKIDFGKCMAFRAVEEGYMNALWGRFAKTDNPGRTFIVEESSWILELAEQDSLFAALCTDARHYVIASDAEVLEVITKFPPRISQEL
jgi:hypothetical protein